MIGEKLYAKGVSEADFSRELHLMSADVRELMPFLAAQKAPSQPVNLEPAMEKPVEKVLGHLRLVN